MWPFGHWWQWRTRIDSELIDHRRESQRIEDKADAALNKVVDVAADTSVMLKRASDAVEKVAHGQASLKDFGTRLRWLETEVNGVHDYLGKLHDCLSRIHGEAFSNSVPHPLKIPDAT